MKRLLPILLLFSLLLTSCSSVRVQYDYDQTVNFDTYKTFAFDKASIDALKRNDFDKKRMMKAIEAHLNTKSIRISNSPDFIIALTSKTQRSTRVYPNANVGFWGGGWFPFWGAQFNTLNTYEVLEGTLVLNFRDAASGALLWQGLGTSPLSNVQSVTEKEEQISKLINSILKTYPPTATNH